jgi:hypothetical protein
MYDNLAAVVTYWDEEQTIPVDYVLKWANDYEAFVMHIVDNTLDAISLGHYPSIHEAVMVINNWNRADRWPGSPYDIHPPFGMVH